MKGAPKLKAVKLRYDTFGPKDADGCVSLLWLGSTASKNHIRQACMSLITKQGRKQGMADCPWRCSVDLEFRQYSGLPGQRGYSMKSPCSTGTSSAEKEADSAPF